MFRVIKKQGDARRGLFLTPHGIVKTPAFMNVATAGAIKGALSADDLKQIHTQVMLANTYHLHIAPGDEIVKKMGGIRAFSAWDGPVLTDSGGFQVFSLAKLRTIAEEGVTFASHLDGRRIFMGPEQSMQIQSHLASTIAMAFDECIENPSEYTYTKRSIERTARWLARCKAELTRLNGLDDTLNKKQMLFGINQGGTYDELRIEHMKRIRELDLDGYAIGGLAVGESEAQMYHVIEQVQPFMPAEKPRYLMGVGTPVNIIQAVARGVDLFDCVMPSRNGRHGHVFTSEGIRNIANVKYQSDERPLDEACSCPVCQKYTRAYIRHLFKAKEMLALRFCVMHNLYFYNDLMRKIRQALEEGCFDAFAKTQIPILGQRI